MSIWCNLHVNTLSHQPHLSSCLSWEMYICTYIHCLLLLTLWCLLYAKIPPKYEKHKCVNLSIIPVVLLDISQYNAYVFWTGKVTGISEFFLFYYYLCWPWSAFPSYMKKVQYMIRLQITYCYTFFVCQYLLYIVFSSNRPPFPPLIC